MITYHVNKITFIRESRSNKKVGCTVTISIAMFVTLETFDLYNGNKKY